VGRGQESDVILEQDFAGAVDEGAAAVAEHLQTHLQGSVESFAGGSVGILLAKVVFHAVTKQEFVAKDFFVGSKNRLPGHKVVVPLATGRLALGEEGFGGSHCLLIGKGE
jgi:hypothetical protein